MRIVYLCHLSPSTCDYPLLLAQAWERLGHQVLLFPFDTECNDSVSARYVRALAGWNRRFIDRWVEKKVDRACSAFHPDVLLCGGSFLSPGSLRRFRMRYGCKTGFILGYNNLLEGMTARLISNADFVIAHDSYVIPIVQGERYGRNPNVFFMPCMADPDEHQPVSVSPVEEDFYGGDVVFIGAWAPDRARLLEQLTHHDLRIYGYGWENAEKLSPFVRDEPVYGLKKTMIYGNAKIVLNIQDVEKQINAISNRIPEVLACGGFVLTDWHGDLEASPLKEGESVACYRSEKDLSDKVAHYLSRPDERERISRNGREAVLTGMTYDIVAERLAEEMAALLSHE